MHSDRLFRGFLLSFKDTARMAPQNRSRPFLYPFHFLLHTVQSSDIAQHRGENFYTG
jgi:hypothetical protein